MALGRRKAAAGQASRQDCGKALTVERRRVGRPPAPTSLALRLSRRLLLLVCCRLWLRGALLRQLRTRPTCRPVLPAPTAAAG